MNCQDGISNIDAYMNSHEGKINIDPDMNCQDVNINIDSDMYNYMFVDTIHDTMNMYIF